jgi:hypothetical protein
MEPGIPLPCLQVLILSHMYPVHTFPSYFHNDIGQSQETYFLFFFFIWSSRHRIMFEIKAADNVK